MIKVLETFTQYGIEYPKGSEIKPGTFETDDLARYLENGFVAEEHTKTVSKPAAKPPLKEQ